MGADRRWQQFVAGVLPRSRAPLQRPNRYLPGLRGRPWHDPRRFAWTRRLESHADVILAEMLASFDRVTAAPHPMGDELAAGAWKATSLYRYGERDEQSCRRFPETARLVASIPGATRAGLVYFSVLAPGAHVTPHCGPTNTRLRCHLALLAPRGAWLRVGTRQRSWRVGKCLVFDDSFEHEAKNPTSEPRVVLLIDVWHPDLGRSERDKLVRLFQAENRRVKSQPPAWAAVGAVRAFGRSGADPD